MPGRRLVIEAVHENIDIKKAVFERLDALCKPETIFASNTSTLWITEISSATMRPEKCIGAHFLIPAAQPVHLWRWSEEVHNL